MKPPLLLLLFVASHASLLALPLSVELAIAPPVLAGFLLMMQADYGRRARRPLVPVPCRHQAPEWFRLAA